MGEIATMKLHIHLGMAAGLALGLTACSTVSLDENAPKGPAPIVSAGQPPAAQAAKDANGQQPSSAIPLPRGARGLSAVTASELLAAGFAADGRASVYFEFDQSVVRRADQPIVEGAAALMKAPNDLQLTIEGNTDDRGTSEYNIALGQRRAETVKRALVILGVDEGRIEATSNGEEKPRKRGSQESDHAENRRADLILR
ncbi:MAG: peptidoglycan-associated lipoprotein Pal [Pseudomonadota bacterium]